MVLKALKRPALARYGRVRLVWMPNLG